MPLTSAASVDLDLLLALGPALDRAPHALRDRTIRQWLIESLLRIRNKHGQLLPLSPNAAQLAYDAHCRRRNIILKARQLGLTTWIAARYFLSVITHPGAVCVQVAHDQRSAEEIFRIVHRFFENLPPRLRGEGAHAARALAPGGIPGALMPSRSNVRQIVFPALDSEYRVESAADPNAGRGITIHHLHCSEVARWMAGDGGADVLAALRAAVPVHGEIALESTPNGAGGIFYEEWQRAAETGYQRHFFPWWIEPGYVAAGSASLAAGNCLAAEHERSNALAGQHSVIAEFTAEESALMRKHSLTAAQILFRRELRSNFRSLAAQEFAEDPESCFLASGECVFDLELIGRRLRELPAPIESRDNGRLLIWLPPRPACPPAAAAPMQLADSEFKIARPAADGRAPAAYLVAVDPAGGSTEGDYTCAQVIELRTGLQCAELHGHFTPAETARRVAQLAREYGHAMIAVERNNHGHAVLAHLTSTERYENVYLRNGQLGWLTSAVTRPQMIEAFAAALTAAPELFSSPRLLRECRSFVRRSDGSPAAAAGAHDDCVMAMAIAMAVRSESQFALPHRAPVEPCFASAALAR